MPADRTKPRKIKDLSHFQLRLDHQIQKRASELAPLQSEHKIKSRRFDRDEKRKKGPRNWKRRNCASKRKGRNKLRDRQLNVTWRRASNFRRSILILMRLHYSSYQMRLLRYGHANPRMRMTRLLGSKSRPTYHQSNSKRRREGYFKDITNC